MSTSITPKSPLRSNRAVNKIDMSTATTPKALLSTKSTSTTPKLSVNTLVSTRSAVTSPITSKQIDIPIPILKTPKRLDSGIIDSSDQINNDAVKDDDPNVIVSGNSNNRFYRSLSISPSKIPRYIKHSKPWIPTNLFTSSRPALSSPPRSLSLRHSFSAPSRYKQLYNNRSIKSAKEFFGSKIDQDDCNENTMNSSDQSICSTSTSTSTTISLQSKEPYKTRLRMRQLTDHLRAREYAGPSVIFSWIIAGFGCMASALSYAELSCIIPSAAWCLTLEYGISGAAVASSWGNKVQEWINGVFRGAASCFFGYIGYDEVCCMAAEAKDPQRVLPQAVLGTIAIVTVFYTLAALALIGMQNYQSIDSDSGFSNAFSNNNWLWAGQLVAVGEIVTLPLVVLVSFLAQPRLLYALSEDGLLSKRFSDLDSRDSNSTSKSDSKDKVDGSINYSKLHSKPDIDDDSIVITDS
eukprot:gene18395-24096_t